MILLSYQIPSILHAQPPPTHPTHTRANACGFLQAKSDFWTSLIPGYNLHPVISQGKTHCACVRLPVLGTSHRHRSPTHSLPSRRSRRTCGETHKWSMIGTCWQPPHALTHSSDHHLCWAGGHFCCCWSLVWWRGGWSFSHLSAECFFLGGEVSDNFFCCWQDLLVNILHLSIDQQQCSAQVTIRLCHVWAFPPHLVCTWTLPPRPPAGLMTPGHLGQRNLTNKCSRPRVATALDEWIATEPGAKEGGGICSSGGYYWFSPKD